MKLTIKTLKCFLLCGILFILDKETAAQTITLPENIQRSISSNHLLPAQYKIPEGSLLRIKKNNIDPAAIAINFSVVSCKTAFTGTVKIEGVVKNTGANMYTGDAVQAAVILYETVPGGTSRAVASATFTHLESQGQRIVSFTRNWDKSAEFPPVYKLVIVYDPDIYIDGNDSNDDMNTNNNSTQREGSDINKIKFPCK